ncbi:MAG: hypothetical protein AAF456_16585 [Planctomycetota bacterium]
MEARIVPARILALLTMILLAGTLTEPASAQRYRAASRNFIVQAPDPHLAEVIAQKAEVFRRELAIEWLGYELRDWGQKCPIDVQIAMQSGGETSFAFIMNPRTGESMPVDWDMHIFGTPERLLDAVLPHEVTHTIFATHFGRPLPRWADEGACTTVECELEKEKNHRMLLSFLSQRPSRGIPFNQMFIMREYPRDILPLYAQGYSLARFLVMLKGRRHFIDYVGAGMRAEGPRPSARAWDATTREFYGFRDLSELQLTWQDWVIKGCPEVRPQPQSSSGTLVSADQRNPGTTSQGTPSQAQGTVAVLPASANSASGMIAQAPSEQTAIEPEPYDDTVVMLGSPGPAPLSRSQADPSLHTFASSANGPSESAAEVNAGWYRSQQRPGLVAAQRNEQLGADVPGKIDMSTASDTIWR